MCTRSTYIRKLYAVHYKQRHGNTAQRHQKKNIITFTFAAGCEEPYRARTQRKIPIAPVRRILVACTARRHFCEAHTLKRARVCTRMNALDGWVGRRRRRRRCSPNIWSVCHHCVFCTCFRAPVYGCYFGVCCVYSFNVLWLNVYIIRERPLKMFVAPTLSSSVVAPSSTALSLARRKYARLIYTYII